MNMRVTSALNEDAVQHADDVCALPLVRRLAATLGRDPAQWRDGDALPRGWHLAFFSVDTPQSALRGDGFAGLGVKLPDLGLPRVVFGGRRIRFHADIPIGAQLTRNTRLLSVTEKAGRSGRFALATVQHEIALAGSREPAITELSDYVMREAVDANGQTGAASASVANTTAARASNAGASTSPLAAKTATPPAMPEPTHRRVVVPDEMLLFRVSAIMFNPHRIHYDQPYARTAEGYPALVVNGSVTSLLLLEFFRDESGLPLEAIALRNGGLAFCGRPLRLNAVAGERQWRLWADDEDGNVAVEGSMGTGKQ